MKPQYLLPLVVTCALALTGCGTPQPKNVFRGSGSFAQPQMETVALTNQLDPQWLKPSESLFTLGPGDKLELEIMGEPTSKVTTVVAPDGKLYFNLMSGIDVWGLTMAQARARLEEELGKYVREKPQISMILRGVESKRVWVLGRVQAPGVYPVSAPMTLLEAIAMAGGTMTMANYRDQEAAGIGEEMADLDRAFLIREGKTLPINFGRLLREGDLAQNIYLQPDDFVYFPSAKAREVYVLGAVTQPRAIPYTEDLTVAAAVASAYGTLQGAWLSEVAVVRGSLSNPQIAIVDYKRVIRGEALDIPLQPKDIVYVPLSPYRYIHRYLDLILNTFVSSAAINAGSAAVDGQVQGAAGIFIPVGSGIQITPPPTIPPIR